MRQIIKKCINEAEVLNNYDGKYQETGVANEDVLTLCERIENATGLHCVLECPDNYENYGDDAFARYCSNIVLKDVFPQEGSSFPYHGCIPFEKIAIALKMCKYFMEKSDLNMYRRDNDGVIYLFGLNIINKKKGTGMNYSYYGETKRKNDRLTRNDNVNDRQTNNYYSQFDN